MDRTTTITSIQNRKGNLRLAFVFMAIALALGAFALLGGSPKQAGALPEIPLWETDNYSIIVVYEDGTAGWGNFVGDFIKGGEQVTEWIKMEDLYAEYGTLEIELGYIFEFDGKEYQLIDGMLYALEWNPPLSESTDSYYLEYEAPPAYDLPDDPVKTGYYFVGWYLDENRTIPYVGQQITEGMSLYAKFITIPYQITYILNGGTNDPANPATYTIESAAISLAHASSRAGYSFASWNSGGYIPAGSTGDKTFTAYWYLDEYGIAYDLNGGTNHPDNPESYTIEDGAVTLADPVKTGYTFTGWIGGDTIAAGSTGDKEFTASWAPTVYTITYDLGGGTNHPDNPETYTIEDGAVTLADPARTGFIFRGWWYDEGHTGPYNPEESKTGDFTLYAEWERIILHVTFYVGGEVYAELDVEYGSTLQAAAQELKEATGANITFFEGEGGDVITESLSIEGLAVKTTNGTVSDFFRDTWYAWAIGGGVLLLIVVLVAIKKRR